MANVGSVELSLTLNKTAFDKDLSSLSKLEIPPLNLDLRIDAKSLNKQLRDLKSGDYGCLELEICPDIKGLSRKLKELPKSLVDCIPVEICPELDTESLKKQFEAIKHDFSLSIQTAVNAAVKVSAVGEGKQGEAANRGADKASQKIEAGFGKAAQEINEAIDTSLKNAAGVIAAPFAGVFRGFFEGIGQNLSRELSNGAIRTFQKTLDVSFKGVGGQAGGFAAKEVGKALGLKPIPKPRTKRDDDESGDASAPQRRSPKPTDPDSGLSKELKSLASELGTFADIMRRAGLGGDKFGSSAINAAKEALELAATFEGLRSAIVARRLGKEDSSPKARAAKKSAATAPVTTTAPAATATSKTTANDVVQADTLAQTAKRGFLKGDVAKVTKEEARNQVEKVRSRLEKELTELQSLPESAQTTKKIEGLVNKITQLQSRIALDIANPDIPKAVRQSLGQLKSTQSKLAETQRNIEATAAKSTSNRKLPDIAKAAAGGLGGVLFSGGSALAAPTGGGAGLGALGALPFDPTLGLAAGGLAAAFAAAKFTPRLLRKVGAQKAADVLEIDVGKIAIDAVTGVFRQVRTSLKSSFQNFGKSASRKNELPLQNKTIFEGASRNLKQLAASLSPEILPDSFDTKIKSLDDLRRKVSANLAVIPKILLTKFGAIVKTSDNFRKENANKFISPEEIKTDNSSKFKAPRNITNPSDGRFKAKSSSLFEQINKNITDSFNSSIKSIDELLKSIKLPPKAGARRQKKNTNSGLTAKVFKQKIEDIDNQITSIIDQVQQDILKKEGVFFSKDYVKSLLQSGKYFDPRFNAAKKQQDFLKQQYERDYNQVVENRPRSSVNRLTGRRRLQTADDPIFQELRTAQKRIDDEARRIQREIFAETGQKQRLSTIKGSIRTGANTDAAFQSAQNGRADLTAELRRREARAIAPQSSEPPPEKFLDRFFRGLEARFYRSPLFKGIAPKDRRSLTSEATGFLASGALLTAPGATTAALGAPLLAALTPLIASLGLVASAVGPLVGTIANTLKQIEPLQKRFEFVGGGKEQGGAQQQFVRGITDELNIPVLPSLEQFSKLAAAARKTKLEGEPLKELFTGIATGAKALQLNAEDLNLVMFAFTQVLSKGKLSAEEVRLQIAERLPGAVGIFARALGVTEAEFNKLLESGSLLAEDVLPKVGRQLQEEYGAAAAAASNTFLSSLTKVENAIFKLQEGFATSLAPVLTTVTNAFAGVLDFFANNAKTVFSTSAVVLTGISAQFFVGLTQILEASGLVGKLTGFLTPLFGRVFTTLTPFAVGILADFLDDIFGAQTSVMENLIQGSYKPVLGLILILNDLKNAVGDFFGSLGENEALSGVISNIALAFRKVGEALSIVRKFLSGTVIEFTSLSLILAQTYALFGQGLNLVWARFSTTVVELGKAFIASARSGKVFSSSLKTLTAGLANSELAAVGATAAFVLFFSKADFANELGSKFDELGDRIAANFERITQNAKDTQKELDKLKPPEFKSKGFDITFGLGESLGLENFKTDDIVKTLNKPNSRNNITANDEILALGGKPSGISERKPLKTIAEKQFEDNIIKLNEFAASANNLAGQIFSGFDTTEAGKSLAAIKRFDEAIAGNQKRRQELLSGPNANSSQVKQQVDDLDAVVAALLKKREELSKPISNYKDSLLDNAKVFQEALKIINDRTDLDEGAKQRLREPLLNAISITDRAIAKLKEMGGIDLSPLGNQFTKVVEEIEKSDRALEKTLNRQQKATLKVRTRIAEELAAGTITPEVAARETTDAEIAALRQDATILYKDILARKTQINQLQAVPNPTQEQQETIDKYQKDVESKELQLAQNRLAIAQKITEGKKQAEGRILKDFQVANAQAAAIVQKAEAARIQRTKRRQLSGAITDEQAQVEIQDAGSVAAKADLAIAQEAIVEFQKVRKTGKISAEEIATRELELNKQVSDAIVRSLDAEIAKRDSLKQKRIADIEELRAKEQSRLDAARANAANRIKQQQLAGTITPDGATNANTEAEIAAAIGTLALSRSRLDDIKKLRAEGTLNAKEAATKEREAIASVATAEGQILDLRLQKQQQFREQNLRKIEEANNIAIALIESSQAQADIAVVRRQLDSSRNEDSDRASERALAFNAAEATRKKIVQAQKEIGGLSRANFETEADYISKRTELNTNLTTLVKEGLEQQLQKQRQVQEDAIRAIDRRVEAQKNQSDLAVQNLEDEKATLDLLNSSIDRSKQLLESRSSLNKAIADAAVVQAEIALEQGDETQKQQLSLNLQNARLEALRQEQRTARELLDLELKRQKISAQMAISEAEIAQSRALIARLEAVGELQKAQENSDNQAIAAAQTRLDLQDKIVASTDKQLENAKANLAIQDELAGNAQKTLSIQQQSVLAQAEAARNTNQTGQTNNASSSSSAGEIDTGTKKSKKLGLFEQSKLNVFAPNPIQKNVSLPPEYFNLKAVTQKAATNSTGSGLSGISAEAELNALAGLKPNESVEDLLKRQLGIDPAESVENYLKKPMSLFYGQDRNNSFQSLNEKYPAKVDNLGQLQQLYAPKIRSFEELNQRYKTDARTFDQLNERYAPKENTSAHFTDSLKAANRGLEDRLDRLNATLAAAVNSPRNLYVSSPEPISDAVSILADINRMNIQSSGLG